MDQGIGNLIKIFGKIRSWRVGEGVDEYPGTRISNMDIAEWVEIEGAEVRRRTGERKHNGVNRITGQSDNHPEEIHQGEASDGTRGAPRFRIVPVQDEHFELKKILRAAFIKQSGSDRFLKLTGLSREDLVLECREVITSLQRLEAEWCNFLKRLVRIDVTRLGYDSHASDELLKQAIEKCTNDVFDRPELRPYWISSPLKASLISLAADEAFAITCDYIAKTIDKLVEHAISQLDCLVSLSNRYQPLSNNFRTFRNVWGKILK